MSIILKGAGVLLLGLAVAGIWGVSATANFAHALQLAGTSEWALVMAGASAAADVLKAGAVLAIIAAFRFRRVGVAFAAALIWVSCSMWSVRSGVGFIATTITDTRVERQFKSSADISIKSELDALPDQIAHLRTQIVTAGSSNARVSLQAEIVTAQARLDELRKTVDGRTAVAHADPVGALLEQHFGVSERTTELATVLLFLALIELGSNLGLVAFSHLLRWPPQVWADPTPPAAREEVAVVAAKGSDTPPAVHTVAAVADAAGRPRLIVNNDISASEGLRRFVEHCIALRGPGAHILVADFHVQYDDYVREHGITAIINSYGMPNATRQLGVRRRHDVNLRRHVYTLPKSVPAEAA